MQQKERSASDALKDDQKQENTTKKRVDGGIFENGDKNTIITLEAPSEQVYRMRRVTSSSKRMEWKVEAGEQPVQYEFEDMLEK